MTRQGRWSNAIERMQNTPGLATNLAMISVVVGSAAFLGLFLLDKYEATLPWENKYRFSAVFDQAPAIQLASHQELRIAGVVVGRIAGQDVTKDGHAKLNFTLDAGHPVYRNASLVLRSKSPINVMYVTLDPGDPSAGKLPEDGTIPIQQTQRVLQPYELLDQLDDRARAALSDLVSQGDIAMANARTDLPPALTAVDETAVSFTDVVTALRERRENLQHLITSVAEIARAAGGSDQRLDELVSALTTTLNIVSTRNEELAQSLDRLPGFTGTLGDAMQETRDLTDELSPVLRELHESADDLPKTVKRLDQTVKSAHEVVEAARPVVQHAAPVLADLRPLSVDVNAALGDLVPVADNLPQATKRLTPWLDNLGAFVYNTSSSFSIGDANGGHGRADVVLRVDQPTGGGLG